MREAVRDPLLESEPARQLGEALLEHALDALAHRARDVALVELLAPPVEVARGDQGQPLDRSRDLLRRVRAHHAARGRQRGCPRARLVQLGRDVAVQVVQQTAGLARHELFRRLRAQQLLPLAFHQHGHDPVRVAVRRQPVLRVAEGREALDVAERAVGLLQLRLDVAVRRLDPAFLRRQEDVVDAVRDVRVERFAEVQRADRRDMVADQVDRAHQVAAVLERARRIPVRAARIHHHVRQLVRMPEHVVQLLEEGPRVVLVEALERRIDLRVRLDEREGKQDEALHVRRRAAVAHDAVHHARDVDEQRAARAAAAARHHEAAERPWLRLDAVRRSVHARIHGFLELLADALLDLVVAVVQAEPAQHAQPARAIVDDHILQITERIPVEPAVQVAVLRAEVALGVPPRVEVAERDEALLRIRQSFLHGRVQLLEIIAVQQKELEGALLRPCSEALTVVIAEELVQTAQHVPTRTTQPDEQRGMDLLQSWYRHRYLEMDRADQRLPLSRPSTRSRDKPS